MIRNPADGSVYEPPSPVIETSTSGLRMTKAQAEYLERLNNSREWLKEYHAMRASNGTEIINTLIKELTE
jgi:hypothetical protein